MTSYQRLKLRLTEAEKRERQLIKDFKNYLKDPNSESSKQFYLRVLLTIEYPDYLLTSLLDKLKNKIL